MAAAAPWGRRASAAGSARTPSCAGWPRPTPTDPPSRTGPTAPLGTSAHHIVYTHHAFLRRELPRVGRLLAKVAGVHGDRHPELFRVVAVFEPFARDMDHHMAKEEQVLFPLIQRLAAGEPVAMDPAAPVRVMVAEHDDAGEAMAEMRRLTDGFRPPEGACGSYRAALAGPARDRAGPAPARPQGE